MKEKTCFFTGHRNITANEAILIKKHLKETITDFIKKGIIYFGCGGARGFDLIAAQVVLEMKLTYPQIKLIMVYPCKNHTRFWCNEDIYQNEIIRNLCDKQIYFSESYDNSCTFRRNRHLVENSNYCICYFTTMNSGTEYTVNYAAKNGLTIINIAKIINQT